MLESLFNNVASLQDCMLVIKRLQHRCFPVSIAKFLRTPSLKCICERLFCISEIEARNYVIYIQAENFIVSFSLCKTFFYLLTLVFASAFFSHTISNISRNISNHLFSSSLNRLNAFSHYHKFVLFYNTQNLSTGFIQQSCRDKHCNTALLIKVTSLKVGYLIL